jgi:hypothetical protein
LKPPCTKTLRGDKINGRNPQKQTRYIKYNENIINRNYTPTKDRKEYGNSLWEFSH